MLRIRKSFSESSFHITIFPPAQAFHSQDFTPLSSYTFPPSTYNHADSRHITILYFCHITSLNLCHVTINNPKNWPKTGKDIYFKKLIIFASTKDLYYNNTVRKNIPAKKYCTELISETWIKQIYRTERIKRKIACLIKFFI